MMRYLVMNLQLVRMEYETWLNGKNRGCLSSLNIYSQAGPRQGDVNNAWYGEGACHASRSLDPNTMISVRLLGRDLFLVHSNGAVHCWASCAMRACRVARNFGWIVRTAKVPRKVYKSKISLPNNLLNGSNRSVQPRQIANSQTSKTSKKVNPSH